MEVFIKTKKEEKVEREEKFEREREELEDRESLRKAYGWIEAPLLLLTFGAIFFRSVENSLIGMCLLRVAVIGNIVYLMYLTLERLYLKMESAENLKGKDAISITCLFLHLVMIAFLCWNTLVVNPEAETAVKIMLRSPFGVFVASSLFLGAQDIMESEIPYHISGILLNVIFTILMGMEFDPLEDKFRGMIGDMLLSILLQIIFFMVEDWAIKKLDIEERKVKKFREFMKIVLIITYTGIGYFIISKITGVGMEKILGGNTFIEPKCMKQ
ncbi:hypothetical protein GPK93_07g12720 [Encephalitozoon intestinalis]|nr:hypothetical protein GPK93_07g12720 [Encephalitozoon intestinalis]